MGFLRRFLGGAGEDRPPHEDVPATAEAAASGAAAPTGARPADDETRARDLARAFDAGLDDLARRQLRFADLAWTPPTQVRRDGDWILMERWEGRRDDGRAVTLKAGERLTYVGEGTAWPGATRFSTSKGERIDLPPGEAADGWPDDLQRPRSTTAGSEDA
jgi:hypothetical protein